MDYRDRGAFTHRTQAQTINAWLTQLSEVNSTLDEAKTIDQYYKKLNDHSTFNSLSFALRRYVYETFTDATREDEPKAYTVTFHDNRDDKNYTYHFSPISSKIPDSDTDPEQYAELGEYADLLFRITLANGCTAEEKSKLNTLISGNIKKRGRPSKGNTDKSKDPAITKQSYLNYLCGHSIERNSLFLLSIALKFTILDMEDFAKLLGEMPYNFRDPLECIYYFCHRYPQYRNLSVVRELYAEYLELMTKHSTASCSSNAQPNTQLFVSTLDKVLIADYPSETDRKNAFLSYLVENNAYISGSPFSKTAHNIFMAELETARKQTGTQRYVRSSSDNEEGNKSSTQRHFLPTYQPPSASKPASILQLSKEFSSYFNLDEEKDEDDEDATAEDAADCKQESNSPSSDKATVSSSTAKSSPIQQMRLKILNSKRIQSLVNQKTAVTKKDLLFLLFYNFITSNDNYHGDYSDLSPRQHRQLLRKFHEDTDRKLNQAGLPWLYAANPLDNLILVSLCSKYPYDFFIDAFEQFDE